MRTKKMGGLTNFLLCLCLSLNILNFITAVAAATKTFGPSAIQSMLLRAVESQSVQQGSSVISSEVSDVINNFIGDPDVKRALEDIVQVGLSLNQVTGNRKKPDEMASRALETLPVQEENAVDFETASTSATDISEKEDNRNTVNDLTTPSSHTTRDAEENIVESNLSAGTLDNSGIGHKGNKVWVSGLGITKAIEGLTINEVTVRSVMESVLRIHVVRSIEDFGTPWSSNGETTATGSGFPIKDRLIITNAHVTTNAHIIRIARPGSPTLWESRVVAFAHEPDLCVLTVDDPLFWVDLQPLEFVEEVPGERHSTVPNVLEGVYVVGYPTGGNSLSVTQGIVSRVEVGYYAHSSSSLLEIQIDAAINPGNSGGPVINANGEVVGVAFQGLSRADSIGYIIPIPIVKHVLEDLTKHNIYTGIVSLGAILQPLQNPILQNYFGLTGIDKSQLKGGVEASGVIVTEVDDRRVRKFKERYPDKTNIGLEEGDVVMGVNGSNVAEDGSIHFRRVERVALSYLLCGKYSGDFITATVLRKKIVMDVEVPLDVPEFLVPVHTNNVKARYVVFGGVVFVPLTKQYVLDYKQGNNRIALSTQIMGFQSKFRTDAMEEIVVVSRILAGKWTKGYNVQNKIVEKINGVSVKSLSHVADLLGLLGAETVTSNARPRLHQRLATPADKDFVKIELLGDKFNFVLDKQLLLNMNEEILSFHKIGAAAYLG